MHECQSLPAHTFKINVYKLQQYEYKCLSDECNTTKAETDTSCIGVLKCVNVRCSLHKFLNPTNKQCSVYIIRIHIYVGQ